MPGAVKLRHPLLCPFLFYPAELRPDRANGAHAAPALDGRQLLPAQKLAEIV
mgnify:FL=1